MAEPLADARGTLVFRGTPVEKHWNTVKWDRRAHDWQKTLKTNEHSQGQWLRRGGHRG